MSDALLFMSIKSSMYIFLFSSSISLNLLSACSINYWEKHTKIFIKIYTNICFTHKYKNVIILDVYIFLCSVNFGLNIWGNIILGKLEKKGNRVV